MKHKDCIFVAEEDCPKEKINLTCADCAKHKTYETIEKAVRDFTGLGENYTEIFTLHKKLIDGHGTTVDIETPVESIFSVNRVMANLLSNNPCETHLDVMYRRLIFYFFKIIIDEFEEEEYNNEGYIH